MPRRRHTSSSSIWLFQRRVQATRSTPSMMSKLRCSTSPVSLLRARMTARILRGGIASTRPSSSGFRANARSNRPKPQAAHDGLDLLDLAQDALNIGDASPESHLSAAGISSAAAVWDTPTRMRARSPLRAEPTSAPMASTSPRARRVLLWQPHRRQLVHGPRPPGQVNSSVPSTAPARRSVRDGRLGVSELRAARRKWPRSAIARSASARAGSAP